MFLNNRNTRCIMVFMGLSCFNSYSVMADDLQKVVALVEALRRAAPQTNDPSLYTDWKMQAGAIASWTKRCIGASISPQELVKHPIMTRDTVTCVMAPILTKQLQLTKGEEITAVRKATAWWMTGDLTQYQSSKIASYLNQVVSEYQKLRANP